MSKKIGIVLFAIIIAYAVWNGRNLLLGPRIKVLSTNFPENPITVRGLAKNVSFISLNDRQIYADKEGNFSEEVLLLPGYNIINISGRDRFGQETSYTLKLYK